MKIHSDKIYIQIILVTRPNWQPCSFDPRHEISNYVVGATSKGSDQTVRMRMPSRLNIL